MLMSWLEEPLVARWWNHETSPECIERDFGPSIDGVELDEICIVFFDGQPCGLIQRYPIAANPAYADELNAVCLVPPGALSVDYFIGVPSMRGRGIGRVMIESYVADAWAVHRGATGVIVPVCVGNRASWRALEGAGFRRIAEGELEPDNPIDPRDHFIYQLDRPETDHVT